MLVGPEAARPRFTSLGAALASAAASRDGSAGLVFLDLDERETFHAWSEIERRAESSAAHLLQLGVEPGDRVAMVLPTSLAFMDAFFGTLLAGAVPVPLYPPVRLGRLDEYNEVTLRMLRLVGAKMLILDQRVRPVLGPVVERSGVAYAAADALAANPERARVERSRDDLGLIQFSSGSTVDPKPVALTHGQLLAQCAVLSGLMQACSDRMRVGVSWLPLYHDMGLIGSLLGAVYYPGRLVLLAPEHFLARPALWLRAIGRHRAFISPAPNFAYAVCAKRVRDTDLEGVDLSCWSLALNGAEPVLASTCRTFAERFERFGFRPEALRPVYGLSEAALAVTASRAGPRVLRRDEDPREIVSVGTPVAGFAVSIRDDTGHELPDGCEGRIHVRGPSIMQGYFGQSEATARVLRDDWLDTGDVGFSHEGELFVSARAKDVIIIRGANHAPQEFEEPLWEVAGVRAGCIVAVGERCEREGGETLVILAERAAGSGRSDAEIAAAISNMLIAATGVRPSLVRVLSAGTLPRTSSGKLRRGEALARHRAGTLTPGRRVTVWSMSGAMIRSAFAYARVRMRPAGAKNPSPGARS